MPMPKLNITFEHDGRTSTANGRTAWALLELSKAGSKGCTPICTPGPRWSAYVHKLKKKHGLSISTVNEKHGGPFSGTHARYVLNSHVRILLTEGDKL